jgi:hypothetical protein
LQAKKEKERNARRGEKKKKKEKNSTMCVHMCIKGKKEILCVCERERG